MVWWLSPRAYQTVLYRIILQKKIHFLHNFLQNSFQNFFKLLFLYIFFIFCNLKKIKSNSLVTVWNALGLSQQTTVSLNYSQSIKINIGPSDGGTIISSSRRPTVLNWRLTDFWGAYYSFDTLELNSVNLWYNTVGWRDDDMIVPLSDGPMFILIDWE